MQIYAEVGTQGIYTKATGNLTLPYLIKHILELFLKVPGLIITISPIGLRVRPLPLLPPGLC